MKRSKACDIPNKVRARVWERDGQCVLCHKEGQPNAHYISRAQGGLGIEENIVTLCQACHAEYDGKHRRAMKPRIREYLKSKYPGWDEAKLYYHKYEWER